HVYYEFEGRRVTLNQLYSQVRKRRGRAKILTSVAVIIGKDEKGRPVPAKIVFVRNRHKSRDWLALLSTDTSLPDDEIVRVYGKRWNVETFFKMTKSYLRLAKEFQGRSYDFMV
ncbi:transposase, partial [Bacillus cereus]